MIIFWNLYCNPCYWIGSLLTVDCRFYTKFYSYLYKLKSWKWDSTFNGNILLSTVELKARTSESNDSSFLKLIEHGDDAEDPEKNAAEDEAEGGKPTRA